MPLPWVVGHPLGLLLLVALVVLGGCTRPPSGSPATPDVARTTYVCESGRMVEASYPTDSTAVVRYHGETYQMSVVVSASGARYAGDGMQWWTKGTGPGAAGFLNRFRADEEVASEEIESCAEVEGSR